jgi:glutamate synthase domain-containing protein 3
MTAGIVLALGATGINFGSGMTGGLAYVLRDHMRPAICNSEFVACTEIEDAEVSWISRVLQQHARLTGSPVAFRLLQEPMSHRFARVQPVHLPCTVSQSWEQVLGRLKPQRRYGESRSWLPAIGPTSASDFPQADAVLSVPEKAEGLRISL